MPSIIKKNKRLWMNIFGQEKLIELDCHFLYSDFSSQFSDKNVLFSVVQKEFSVVGKHGRFFSLLFLGLVMLV